MKHPSLYEHPSFALLLLWRALLALLALYTTIEKPFGVMLTSLATIGFFLLAGEFAYRYKVQLDHARQQKERERELRERRAEEARLRLEAAKAEQSDGQRKSFGLDDDAAPTVAPAKRQSATEALSAEDFDVALMGAEFTRKLIQEDAGA